MRPLHLLDLSLVLAACGGAAATPTLNPEPVTFSITAPFDSRQLTPDTPDGARIVDAGETVFTWEAVTGAARYEVWIFDRSDPATLNNPVPGKAYSEGETDETSWRVSFAASPGDAGREMSVEVSAYGADGQWLGFSGRYVFVVKE